MNTVASALARRRTAAGAMSSSCEDRSTLPRTRPPLPEQPHPCAVQQVLGEQPAGGADGDGTPPRAGSNTEFLAILPVLDLPSALEFG